MSFWLVYCVGGTLNSETWVLRGLSHSWFALWYVDRFSSADDNARSIVSQWQCLVLPLRQTHKQTDVRQTDVRQQHHYMPPPIRGGGIRLSANAKLLVPGNIGWSFVKIRNNIGACRTLHRGRPFFCLRHLLRLPLSSTWKRLCSDHIISIIVSPWSAKWKLF